MTTEQKILMGAIVGSGMFKVDLYPYTSIKDDIFNIKALYEEEFLLERGSPDDLEHEQLSPKECTLLARPVEDMTREEERGLRKITANWFDSRKFLFLLIDSDTEAFLYLLSMGVLTKDLVSKLPCKVEWITTKQEK